MMSPFYMKRKRHPEVAGSCASIITANPAGFLDLNHCLISFNWHPPVASPIPRSTGKSGQNSNVHGEIGSCHTITGSN